MNPFDSIYKWFQGIYGSNLADLLAGYDCTLKDFTLRSSFTGIGFATLAVAVVFFVLYYYIINSTKFNKWWHWLIVVVIVAVCGLFIGEAMAYTEGIEDCLLYMSDEDDNLLDTLAITPASFWNFGIANSLVAAMFFIILSFAGKWGSSACRRTPF